MKFVKVTDFRNNAKAYFEQIEQGESYVVIRKGKPVARVIPFEQNPQGWKREVSKVSTGDEDRSSLDILLEERSEG